MNRVLNNLRARHIEANVIASEISNRTSREAVNSILRNVSAALSGKREISAEQAEEVNKLLKQIERTRG